MQGLRSARFLARLVLAWFALVVGLAAAAPALHPQALDLVCTGSGMKLVPVDAGDGDAPQPAGLDCPLCVAVLPPPAQLQATPTASVGVLPAFNPASRSATAAAPALPPRGPPVLST